MTDNLKIFKSEYNRMKGQFVIYEYQKVGRFMAIISDQYDYYYLIFDGKRFECISCVTAIFKLKGKIAKHEYERLIYLAKNNHYDFILNDYCEVFKNNISRCKVDALTGIDLSKMDYETPIYWELN